MRSFLVLAVCVTVSLATLATDFHRRVVGSSAAAGKKNAPYMVNIQAAGDFGFEYRCSGALVGDRWVVTAAHCILGYRDGGMRVVLGDYSRGRQEDSEQVIGISKVIPHPKFGLRPGYPMDVGLLRLSRAASFNSNVKPLSLGSTAGPDFNSDSCYIVGWGRKSASSSNSDALRRIRVTYINNDVCTREWADVPGTDIFGSHVCAKSAGGKPCSVLETECTLRSWTYPVGTGDNGSPLVCGDLLAGVSSWGDATCTGSRAGVFTRISSCLPWIKSVMDPS